MRPQPWLADDGTRVAGIPLTGDLAHILSLEDETMPGRRALIAMASHLHRATLVGNPAPIVAEARARIDEPRPGDLVVDWTSFRAAHHQRGDWYRMIGVLLVQRDEWASTDADWQAELDSGTGITAGDRYSEQATYIQYGPSPNDVCRWVNCQFLMVPFDADQLSWA